MADKDVKFIYIGANPFLNTFVDLLTLLCSCIPRLMTERTQIENKSQDRSLRATSEVDIGKTLI